MKAPIEPVVMPVHLPAGVAGPDPLDFDVRCFLVPHSAGVVLMDTGLPGSSPLIGAGLERLGATWADVSDIVLTHRHPDHTGGLAELMNNVSGATVWAGEGDKGMIEFTGSLQTLVEGGRVRGLTVFQTPGHTPGHCSLMDEEASIVFAGDVVGSMAGEFTRGPAAFTADPDLAERSLRRLAKLAADRILVSHGDEVSDPGPALQSLVAARR